MTDLQASFLALGIVVIYLGLGLAVLAVVAATCDDCVLDHNPSPSAADSALILWPLFVVYQALYSRRRRRQRRNRS